MKDELKKVREKFEGTIIISITDLLSSPSSDKIVPSIEDVIIRADSLDYALRLVAIQSLAAEGLKTSILQIYRKMIFQVRKV